MGAARRVLDAARETTDCLAGHIFVPDERDRRIFVPTGVWSVDRRHKLDPLIAGQRERALPVRGRGRRSRRAGGRAGLDRRRQGRSGAGPPPARGAHRHRRGARAAGGVAGRRHRRARVLLDPNGRTGRGRTHPARPHEQPADPGRRPVRRPPGQAAQRRTARAAPGGVGRGVRLDGRERRHHGLERGRRADVRDQPRGRGRPAAGRHDRAAALPRCPPPGRRPVPHDRRAARARPAVRDHRVAPGRLRVPGRAGRVGRGGRRARLDVQRPAERHHRAQEGRGGAAPLVRARAGRRRPSCASSTRPSASSPRPFRTSCARRWPT